jgi:hypothetical protein
MTGGADLTTVRTGTPPCWLGAAFPARVIDREGKTTMPVLDLFWSVLYIFFLILWIWLVIMVFFDIFRTESSGWVKAGWTILVIVFPLIGVLIYLIVNGSNMHERSAQSARQMEQAQRDYIRSVASGSSAEELKKLAELRDQGVLSEEEFQQMKAKALA